jgi:hypothetical protein
MVISILVYEYIRKSDTGYVESSDLVIIETKKSKENKNIQAKFTWERKYF